jgi:hypothetical protein
MKRPGNGPLFVFAQHGRAAAQKIIPGLPFHFVLAAEG